MYYEKKVFLINIKNLRLTLIFKSNCNLISTTFFNFSVNSRYNSFGLIAKHHGTEVNTLLEARLRPVSAISGLLLGMERESRESRSVESREENMDQSEYSEEESQNKDTPEDLSMGSKEENHPQRNSIEK